MRTATFSRRTFSTFGALSVLAPATLRTVAAQNDAEGTLAEVPTTGGRRPGPMIQAGGSDVSASVPEGFAPIAIQIDTAQVSADIERIGIVEGVMQNPSGPWIVSWYEDLPSLGQGSNVVMAGHVDYWNVGPAVFWALKEPGLAEDDAIRVVAEDQTVYEYAVQWSRTYSIDELTPETINAEIVGPTDDEVLTLITCGGEFDAARGEYLSRIVVRSAMVGTSGA